MPSEKRARQRAMREVRQAAIERRRRRRRSLRRAVAAVVVAGLVVLVVALVSTHKSPKVAATTAIAPVCPATTGTVARHVAFTKSPPVCIVRGATYEATVKTDVGTFIVSMPAAKSPVAVNNFVFLARYHFYDGLKFFRVIPGNILQGGSTGNTDAPPRGAPPGYSFTGNTPAEACYAKKDCYPIGSVAMANSGSPSSDESQFFVVAGAAGETYKPDYTLFGKVTSGLSVVKRIAADGNPSPAANGIPPKKTHHIVSVTISKVAS